jgi:hypothetical protein
VFFYVKLVKHVVFWSKNIKRVDLFIKTGHSQVVLGLKGFTRLTKWIVFELTLNGLAGQPEPIPPTRIANPN